MKRIVMSMIISSFLMLDGCAYSQSVAITGTGPGSGVMDVYEYDPSKITDDSTDHLPSREEIVLNPDWDYAELSEINTGTAVLYRAGKDRKDIVVGVNAGHGTIGGENVKTYCHPDKTPKITNGSNPVGSLKAVAISAGMTFADGATEAEVALRASEILRDRLLECGYDVLMIRDEEDERLDNVARTVIANNRADCLVSLHWDGDNLKYDKGCFFVPVPDEIKDMEPVASNWKEHERLGRSLIKGLENNGSKIYRGRNDPLELTQTCYSTIPSVVIELGNAASSHDDADLSHLADGLFEGINSYFS